MFIEFMYMSDILEGNEKSYDNYVRNEVYKFVNGDKDKLSFLDKFMNLCIRANKDGINTYDQHGDNIGIHDNIL